ncbi:PQQ-binding-like beta-propeller repeat protein [Brachybacterium sp. YJGR34]|uniref:outer membrane protein assembly factor BamB family protein n=1 Tax=Brachybacterium sp. YJGR34 TaxID=2059911 RepID=UPI000E0A7F74|nr:PQQ-binding-like beta-propeller repeat protein [Brachybacterium sp. YJGR34]
MSSLSRRSLLSATAVGGAAVAMYSPHARPAAAAPTASADQVIAFITDVHVDPEADAKMAGAQATVDALIAQDPDLILHGGDITEYGSVAELQAWLDLLPAGLRERVHHVPGNHETRWDASGFESYREAIGALQHSVDLGDLHIVLTDPTLTQQQVGYHDQADLDWLHADLAQAKGRPILAVGHYPIGVDSYYISNREDLISLLADAGVAGFLSGHIHRERITRVNGITEFVGVASRNEPGFYLLTRQRGEDTDELQIERVTAADPTRPDAEPGRRPAGTIDLSRPTPDAQTLRPQNVTATVSGNQLEVRVVAAGRAPIATVEGTIHPHTRLDGTGEWHAFEADGPHFDGLLDLSALVPGEHRVIVRVTGEDGAIWREVVPFAIDGFTPAWTLEVNGSIQGALAEVDGIVVAATTTGEVRGVRADGGTAKTVWTHEIGAVHSNLATDAETGRVFVPTGDHQVHAFDAATGEVLWSTDLGAPVMSDLGTGEIDGTAVVLACAMETFACLDAATGEVRWTWEMPQVSCGLPVTDGERVYVGGGDGNAWAVDARTGEPLWHKDHSNRSGSYSRLIYGPWDTQLLLMPEDLLVVAAVEQLRAVDRATGETVWEITGAFRHSTPTMLGEDLLVTEEDGTLRVIEPATGTVRLEHGTEPDAWNPAMLIDAPAVTVTGMSGLIEDVDTDAGTSELRGQISRDLIFASPVALEGGAVQVFGTMGGELRAYARG